MSSVMSAFGFETNIQCFWFGMGEWELFKLISESSAIWNHREMILQPTMNLTKFLYFCHMAGTITSHASIVYTIVCVWWEKWCAYLICAESRRSSWIIICQPETTCAFWVPLNGPGECWNTFLDVCSCLYHNPGLTCKPDSSQRSQSHYF